MVKELKMQNEFCFDRKRWSCVAFILLLLFIWIVFAFNSNNPDYRIYNNWYDSTRQYGVMNRFELGFSYLMFFSVKLGLSYQQFNVFVATVGLFLIGISLYKYCRYPFLTLCLYSLYPFVFDVVQIRNFLAEAIILFAIRYLIEFNIKNLIKYIGFCAIAMLFHVSSAFYLLFLVAYIKNYATIVRIITITTIGYIVVWMLFPGLVRGLFLAFGNSAYFDEGSTQSKIVGYTIFAIIAIVLMYLTHFGKNRIIENGNDCFAKIVPVLLLCCVAIGGASQAYRLFRNMAPIVYIAFLNDGVKKTGMVIKGKNLEYINTLFALFFSFFFFFRQVSPWSAQYEVLTKTILESNLLFFK